ncbi:MAG: S53 family peptidase [Solirubrobacteraceae bacterium]
MRTAWKPARLALVALSSALALQALAGNAGADAAQSTIARDTCPAPALGRITCDAQVLVSRRNGKPVRPMVKARRARHNIASTGLPAPQQMTPAYLQQAYDLTYLSANRGGGDTVAIVGVYDDPAAASDLATFRSTYGLSACTPANGCFRQMNEQGQASPLPAEDTSWAQEESMDIEAVSALCPNCKVDLVEANAADAQDLQAAVGAAVAAGANQVSISGDGIYTQNPFTDFSSSGVSIDVATGDNGALPTGEDAYPAALPYVTAVGGTTLAPATPTAPNARGIVETAWNGSSAGCDTQEQPLPYQPSDGCSGRSYADISADADPSTGLTVYDSPAGGWFDGGGTSLAAPLVAAFQAITGVNGSTPQWAYTDAANLNDPTTGSTGACAGELSALCNAATGYDGPTGAGSISGQIAPGAPGIGLPSLGPSDSKTYTLRLANTGAWLRAGVYPNGEATSYYWQYGTTSSYGSSTAAVSVGAGAAPVSIGSHLATLKPGTKYHYRLVATNASGTEYGYDGMFATTGHAMAAKARRTRAKHRRHAAHKLAIYRRVAVA